MAVPFLSSTELRVDTCILALFAKPRIVSALKLVCHCDPESRLVMHLVDFHVRAQLLLTVKLFGALGAEYVHLPWMGRLHVCPQLSALVESRVAYLAKEGDGLFLQVFGFVTEHVVFVSHLFVGGELAPVTLELTGLSPHPDPFLLLPLTRTITESGILINSQHTRICRHSRE